MNQSGHDGARRGVVRLAFWGVLILLQIAVLEGMAHLAFWFAPQFERTRQLLRGDVEYGPLAQYSVGQAYLLYIPAPNYRHESGLEHNAHGYRGRALTQARTPGTARILFLGGSTTYGWGVTDSGETYPAHLERLLRDDPPAGFRAVEVINAGIPWGTTAEMLTHYHFKFTFYDPDLVVLNPGGNDAQGLLQPFYHPDYSHWRQPLLPPPSLAPRARRLLQSRLLALFLVPVLYDPAPDSRFVAFDNEPPHAVWYDRTSPNPEHHIPDIPRDEIAFFHNTKALLDEIQNDGRQALLVPFRLHPQTDLAEEMVSAAQLEEEILGEFAIARGLPIAPFPADVISRENWLDLCCHVNGPGNLEKARHVLPYVRDALEALAARQPRQVP